MAADLLSIVKQIWYFGLSIKTALEKAEHNAEDCRRIGDLLGVLGAISNSKHLQGTPEATEEGGFTRDAAARLDDALGRASELVARCERKGLARRAWKADDIAEKLRGICLDVLLNMIAVLLVNGVNLTAMLAEVKEDVARILQIVDARPDVHLQKEVAKLVQAYQNSTEYASPQIRNKRETKKTDVAAISQSRNKRETKKTDGTTISQTKSKRETKKAEVARQEVKIQKNRSKVAPHASLRDGLADQSDSADGVVGQYGSRTFIDKASSSVPKLMDEVQSVAVSAAPFQLQKIISVSRVPGEAGRYKISSKSSKTSKLLKVYPLKLRFPLKPNKETMRCPVTLINKTDHHVGVWIKPTNERFTKTTILEPHSTLVVSLTTKMHEQLPKDSVKFEVLMIIIQSKKWKHNIAKLDSSIAGKLNMDRDFMACVEKLQAEVYWAMLTPSIWEPASC